VKARTNKQAGRSRICLSLTGSTVKQDLEELQAFRRYVDVVELRADFLQSSELENIESFPRLAAVPAILAIRRRSDGGLWAGREAARRRLIHRALSGSYSYVDLEEDLIDRQLMRRAAQTGTTIIRSFHDFEGVPEDLVDHCKTLAQRGQEIPKLAVTPQSTQDMVALARAFERLEGQQKILIGMGERGLFSRILAEKLGSLVTYCSSPNLQPAAPGHLDPRTLVELYGYRRQNRQTAVCGVIGEPIAHSRSPEFHNRGYEALGLNFVYIPFLVDDPKVFFKLAAFLHIRGISVTMPHKEAVMPLLEERDGNLEGIGACNTVVRSEKGGGGWFGTNTDVKGFLAPIEKQAPELLQAGTRATVIGAGGAARSVVYALKMSGISPLIVNRTPRRARELALLFGCDWAGLDRRAISRIAANSDLIVQATSVGMEGDVEGDPLPEYRFSGAEVLYDLVYQPRITTFVRRAREAGCRWLSGLDMLFAQGAEQFKLFTGRDYPLIVKI